MSAARLIVVGAYSVTVKELTVTDVRNWVAIQEAGIAVDVVGQMVFDDCSLDDLARMSDMSIEAMNECTHAQLLVLRDACRGLNPHFFKVREALVNVSRVMQAELDSLSSTRPSQP